jgi:outer membrane protein with beta-barrel domain
LPRTAAAIVLAIAVLLPAASSAQVSAPGPYVIDLRAAMTGAPGSGSFYPPITTAISVPQRAFGVGAGAHVYAFKIGVARLGFGVDLLRTRGTATTEVAATAAQSTTVVSSTGTFRAAMTVTTIAPQLSFNFGSHEGWSYLSGGYGISTTHAEVNVPASFEGQTGSRNRHTSTVNVGGGARWFLRERMAVGFDVRFHRLLATHAVPSTQMVGLSVGLSLR